MPRGICYKPGDPSFMHRTNVKDGRRELIPLSCYLAYHICHGLHMHMHLCAHIQGYAVHINTIIIVYILNRQVYNNPLSTLRYLINFNFLPKPQIYLPAKILAKTSEAQAKWLGTERHTEPQPHSHPTLRSASSNCDRSFSHVLMDDPSASQM